MLLWLQFYSLHPAEPQLNKPIPLKLEPRLSISNDIVSTTIYDKRDDILILK